MELTSTIDDGQKQDLPQMIEHGTEMPDGRYLIYYDFDSAAGQHTPEDSNAETPMADV